MKLFGNVIKVSFVFWVFFLLLFFDYYYYIFFFKERCLVLPANMWTARGKRKVDIFVLLSDQLNLPASSSKEYIYLVVWAKLNLEKSSRFFFH